MEDVSLDVAKITTYTSEIVRNLIVKISCLTKTKTPMRSGFWVFFIPTKRSSAAERNNARTLAATSTQKLRSLVNHRTVVGYPLFDYVFKTKTPTTKTQHLRRIFLSNVRSLLEIRQAWVSKKSSRFDWLNRTKVAIPNITGNVLLVFGVDPAFGKESTFCRCCPKTDKPETEKNQKCRWDSWLGILSKI